MNATKSKENLGKLNKGMDLTISKLSSAILHTLGLGLYYLLPTLSSSLKSITSTSDFLRIPYLFGHTAFEIADFTDLPAAFLTLFQIMTLDNWSEVMDTTSGALFGKWVYQSFFVSFVILTAIISFNVFVAVLTTQVQRKVLEEKKLTAQSITSQIEEEIEESEAELQKVLSVLLSEMKELKAEVKSLKQNSGKEQ